MKKCTLLFVTAVFCLLLPAMSPAQEKVFAWKKPGGNPSSLGLLAIDSLDVPDHVKEGWKNIPPESVRSGSLTKGARMNQLTYGGQKKYTKHGIKENVICLWADRDSMATEIRVYEETQTDTSGLKVTTRTTHWLLYSFPTVCDNIGWTREYVQQTAMMPEPEEPDTTEFVELVQPEPEPEPSPPPPDEKIICSFLEFEGYTGAGYVGFNLADAYPHLYFGQKTNWYPWCSPHFAASAKLFWSRQANYNPHDHPPGFDWGGMKTAWGPKLGFRFQIWEDHPLIGYVYAGKTWYDGSWSPLWDKELELVFVPSWGKLEATYVQVNPVGYFWSRTRLKANLGSALAGQWFLGPEFYHQGRGQFFQARAEEPDEWYSQRLGLIAEYFTRFVMLDYPSWGNLQAYGGWDFGFGYYFGLEAALGLPITKQKTPRGE